MIPVLTYLNVVELGHLDEGFVGEVVDVLEVAKGDRPAQEVLVQRPDEVRLDELTVEQCLAQ